MIYSNVDPLTTRAQGRPSEYKLPVLSLRTQLLCNFPPDFPKLQNNKTDKKSHSFYFSVHFMVTWNPTLSRLSSRPTSFLAYFFSYHKRFHSTLCQTWFFPNRYFFMTKDLADEQVWVRRRLGSSIQSAPRNMCAADTICKLTLVLHWHHLLSLFCTSSHITCNIVIIHGITSFLYKE